jgi:hypothetical protein
MSKTREPEEEEEAAASYLQSPRMMALRKGEGLSD